MAYMRTFTFVIFLFLFSIASAQPNFQWHDSIPVKVSGNYLDNPWAGGLNFVQISNIDLNIDGKKDVITFDRSGNKLRTFINNGTVGAVDLTYAPEYENNFPFLHDWVLLVDYNCDNKEDIFAFSDIGVGIKIYKNISTVSTGLQFLLVEDLLPTKYNPPTPTLSTLYITPVDIPAFCDIDNDTDIDIVTFSNSSTYIEYHQNQSMELYGSCDSLIFEIANKCWGYASEDAMSNNFTLNDTCVSNISTPELPVYESDVRSSLHSGGSELCLDLNGDGDKEIVIGDISYNNLTMLTNGGTPTNAHFTAIDVSFPANNLSTTSTNMTVFPAAYYADMDYDGVKDLIVCPNAPNFSENANSLVYYKNNGANNFPDFEFVQNNVLQDNMIELGEGAYPVLFDYDNDGLKDLFIGNYGYYAPSAFQPKIAQYKNIGTATHPEFDLITLNYMNLSSLNILNMIPTFGDLDGDTDADMIIGGFDGKLHYFENTASIGATANFTLVAANFKNSNNRVIDVGDCAAPQIVDVDGDGKNDLIVGARNGKLAYYNHIGTGTTSIPAMDSVSHFWGNVKVNRPGYFIGYSYPFLFKQGGVSKLMVGAESGYLQIYDSIDGNLGGTFTKTDTTFLNIFQGTRTAPFGADITNDGLIDLMVGNYSGGLSFYKGTSGFISVEENVLNFNVELFPNPASNAFTIKIINEENKNYVVDVYTLKGQLITTNRIENNTISINTENFSQGMYICKISEVNEKGIKQSGSLSKRVIVQH
ncbi:MAG: T9SS type A sorting domain-containing protein [Bacteroidetes bacterium]|nr:T9SS type A sorting domain-containing protein [Bacteroidota bacterium]